MSGGPSREERLVQTCYSTWSGTYYDEYYGEDAPYPPVHRDMIRELLRRHDTTSLLDAGCGPASFLREMTDEGMTLFGFDLTPEMVEEARRVLAARGVPEAHIWTGSVTDPGAFRAPPGVGLDRFDATICIGVLPHVPEALDEVVVRNLRDSVRPGGLVVLEARNQLFSLFTLNRYSYEFFKDVLLAPQSSGAGEADGAIPEPIMEGLRDRFRMDLPPIRRGKENEPGYDEVLSRTHNPHVLRDQVVRAGFDDVRVLFYHYHALPPMFEQADPVAFRQRSVAMEDPQDWRGYYMASAFLVVGTRA